MDADLRWRTRAFGSEVPAGAVLEDAAFEGAALGGAAVGGAALWGGALGVAAPLSARLPAPRVVLLLVVMTSPEDRPTGGATITYDGNETARRVTKVLDMTLTDLAGLATLR